MKPHLVIHRVDRLHGINILEDSVRVALVKELITSPAFPDLKESGVSLPEGYQLLPVVGEGRGWGEHRVVGTLMCERLRDQGDVSSAIIKGSLQLLKEVYRDRTFTLQCIKMYPPGYGMGELQDLLYNIIFACHNMYNIQ